MSALPQVLSGRVLSKTIFQILKQIVDTLRESNIRITLAVIIVGDHPEALQYHKLKRDACEKVGAQCILHELPSSIQTSDLELIVKRLAADQAVTGIHIDFPLPSHICTEKVLQHIPYYKDVDGVTPFNLGQVVTQGYSDWEDGPLGMFSIFGSTDVGEGFSTASSTEGSVHDETSAWHAKVPRFLLPCTPSACIGLLRYYNINPRGQNVVVIGRSTIVSKPLALLLTSLDATVTVCHRQTKDLQLHLQNADIVCVAVGIPYFLRPEWLQPGTIVLDIGMHCIDSPSTESSLGTSAQQGMPGGNTESVPSTIIPHTIVCGDVATYRDPVEAEKMHHHISPVPGGIGPVTVAMSVTNLISAYYLQRHLGIFKF